MRAARRGESPGGGPSWDEGSLIGSLARVKNPGWRFALPRREGDVTMLLSRTLSHDRQDRLPDDDHVTPPRARFHVLDVVLDPLLEVTTRAACAANLPEARDAGADAEARFAPGRAELVFAVGAWPRADDRHVPGEDVEKLWNLVEVVFAEDLADAREARIVLDVELRAVRL